MIYTAVLQQQEEGGWVAHCPELDVVSQGDTVEEALANIKEAVEVYLEELGEPAPSNGPVLVTTFEVARAG